MIAALALALAGLGGDTPIEPITSDTVEFALSQPDAAELCLMIADQGDLVRSLAVVTGDEFSELFLDMQIAYWADTFEEGYGGSLTVEARDIFDTWVDGCQGR